MIPMFKRSWIVHALDSSAIETCKASCLWANICKLSQLRVNYRAALYVLYRRWRAFLAIQSTFKFAIRDEWFQSTLKETHEAMA